VIERPPGYFNSSTTTPISIQDQKFRIQDQKFRIQDQKFRIQDQKFSSRDTKFKYSEYFDELCGVRLRV
jgi:hypothetical protein